MDIIAYIIGLGGVVAALLSWIPLLQFLKDERKERAAKHIEEGRRLQVMEQMQSDISSAHEKIREQDGRITRTQESIIEMKGDIKHLVTAVDKIGTFLEKQGCV
jgi:peptidoglycan hydrolase CwlO-like protein